MPSVVLPETPHYMHAPPTQEQLDYAELAIIDLSKANTSEGRRALAEQTRDAMTTHGFFYAINHGYTPAQVDRIFDIANLPFVHVSDEEKRQYDSGAKTTGSYQGYKLKNHWHIGGGVWDQIEHYNINKDVTKRAHPKVLRPFLPEIEAFAKHNHYNVLHPILRLLALGLELPEDTLVNVHGYAAVGETYVRFMKYYPRPDEEEEKAKNVWLKGHTDFGSITILYSQPVAGLQILSRDGKWKWVKHISNALVINAGDAMEFLSGGYYRATIHRVIRPPNDQKGKTRLGAFYFCMSNDDVKLAPLAQSPVLKRVGIIRRFTDEEAPTMKQWRKGRTAAYGQTELRIAADATNVEEEYIGGVLVKHYN
ncbi:hypothetical protein AX15_000272 [Amanita polypyramis BW_CC]|nr:hypothetical protein AX15_000272 [Amanita polypyramis BW_CC]